MPPTELRHRPVSRRCALLGAGGVGAAAVLAACSSGSSGSDAAADPTGATSGATSAAGSPTAPSSAASSAATSGSASAGGSGAAAIAALSDVPVGGTATVQVDGETVLLSQPSAGTVEGFSAVCPHQGATVQPDDGKFHCPLHGSEFALDGSVTEGPARSGLTPFAVTVSGDSVVKA